MTSLNASNIKTGTKINFKEGRDIVAGTVVAVGETIRVRRCLSTLMNGTESSAGDKLIVTDTGEVTCSQRYEIEEGNNMVCNMIDFPLDTTELNKGHHVYRDLNEA